MQDSFNQELSSDQSIHSFQNNSFEEQLQLPSGVSDGYEEIQVQKENPYLKRMLLPKKLRKKRRRKRKQNKNRIRRSIFQRTFCLDSYNNNIDLKIDVQKFISDQRYENNLEGLQNTPIQIPSLDIQKNYAESIIKNYEQKIKDLTNNQKLNFKNKTEKNSSLMLQSNTEQRVLKKNQISTNYAIKQPSENKIQLQKEKLQHRQRFSFTKLQMLSRKFSDYYISQTARNQQGITLRQIADSFDLNHATIHQLYTEWINDPFFYKKMHKYDKFILTIKNQQKRLTIKRLQHIGRLLKDNPFLTQNELCVQLNKIEELKSMKGGETQDISRSLISRLLKIGKFKKKRVRCIPKEKNTSKSLEKRHQYCVQYKAIVNKGARIFFLDESGFHLYMTRQKAWSRPNEEITVNCPISKGKRFSLIASIESDGLAHWKFIQGSYRRHQFVDFIREMFIRLRQQQSSQEIWLLMDNCSIHDRTQTEQLSLKYNMNIMYLPAYSPQLNPIENWFHEIKCKLRKINYTGERALAQTMQKLLKEYQQHDFSNYFSNTWKYVEKGLNRQCF